MVQSDTSPSHQLLFFLLQPVTVLVQTIVARGLRASVKSTALRRWVNIAFALTVSSLCSPYLSNDLLQCKIWDNRFVPIVNWLGLGY